MPTMLPALPDTFGNIRHVLPAAFASLAGRQNVLALPKVEHAVVILVDGLGLHNLQARAAIAPTLSAFATSPGLNTVFPSSTVANIASIASGLTPAEHGLFGYRIFDRARDSEFNLLSGMDKYSILDYLKSEPISKSENVNVITLPAYRDSGFTRATMDGAQHHYGDSLAERFDIAAQLARTPGQLTYLYVPELDQSAHAHGWQSSIWDDLLRQLDAAVQRFISELADGVGVLLTADHGVVDVEPSGHLFLDEVVTSNELASLGGDTRAGYLYIRNSGQVSVVHARVQAWLGSRGSLLSLEDAFTAGLFGEQLREDSDLLPDLVLLPGDGFALYHREFSKATSMRMIGQHGGLSKAEIEVPLLRMAAYSSSEVVP